LWSKYYNEDLRKFNESSKKKQDCEKIVQEIENKILNLDAQIDKRDKEMEKNRMIKASLEDKKTVSEDICSRWEKSWKEKVLVFKVHKNTENPVRIKYNIE
jgi:hypothetical protein